MKPQLYRGLPGGFDVQTETASDSYFSEPRLGRTLAAGDLDGDGRIDLVANHLDRPVALLMNRSEAGRWIEIELVGRFSDRDAVGAVAELRCGEQIWVAWQTGGDGYMCTNEPVLHVGLGDYRRVDSLTVRWPGGTTQTLTGLAADRRHLVIEPPQPSSRNASDP